MECIQCASSYVPVKTCYNRRVYFSAAVNTPLNISQNFTPVDCSQAGSSSVLPSNDYCKTYKKVGNSFLCQECHFGYTGPILFDSASQTKYVNCNFSVPNCDATTVLGHINSSYQDWLVDMFGFNLSQNFSCHKCSGTMIPFLHLSYLNKLSAYDLNNTTTIPSQTGSSGYLTSCREPSASTFNIPSDQFNFPSNCALGLLVVDRTLSANYTNGTIRCMACKNGYVPVVTNNKYVTACQPISNCDATNAEPGIMNACRYCSNGYAHPYTSATSLDYSSCIQINYATDGCDFFYSVTQKCKICKKNYQLNLDGICEKFTGLCNKVGEYQSVGTTVNGDANGGYSANIYLNSYGKGCYSCPDNLKSF